MGSSKTVDRAKLTEGPVGETLIQLAIPMMFGILAIMIFNIVDTIYVGQLGADSLAAISFTFPVVFVVMSLAMGLGIGTSSVVSRAIGEGDHHKVQRLTTDSLVLSLILVISVAGLGLLTIEPVFRLMGATPEMMPLIEDYMTVWYLGVGFLVVPMVGNSAIRATGDTKTPSIIMIIAGVINIILDPFFIFGIGPFPRLELTGAALVTVISYVVVFFTALWVLGKREKMIDFSIPPLQEVLQSWKQVLHVGLPAAVTNMLVPISAAIITRMVSEHGSSAVAAFGVGSRLESLAMIGVMALSSVLTPFVGQNWGAGKCERVKEAVRFSLKFSLLWGGAVFLILVIGARPLARIFTDDEVVIEAVIQFLWFIPISYGLSGMAMLVNSTYNALHKPLRSVALIVIRLFVLTIPLAYLGSVFWGLKGIFAGMAFANICIGIIAYFWVREYIVIAETQTIIDEPEIFIGIGNLPEQEV